MEPITTEQRWNKEAMAILWKHRDELGVSYQLDKLWKSRVKSSRYGVNKITYAFSKTEGKKQGKLGFGRLYSVGGYGFEMVQNEIRGTLCQDYYYDIDVKNAQPTLLYQFAQREFQVELSQLKQFCENRDEYYALISENREEAKSALFRVLYGGSCEYSFLRPLKEELEGFALKLRKLPQYLELYKACQESKPMNSSGSFLSYLAQTEERKVMLAMREFFMSKGWSVDCLCFDGIMVRKEKDKEITATLLEEAEGAVLQKTNYSIQLVNKPFSTLDLSEFEEEEKILAADVIVDDAYAGKAFVEIAGDDLVSADGQLFAKIDGIWSSGEDAVKRLISTHREKLIFKQEAKQGVKIYNYGGMERNITAMLKQIQILAKPGKLPIQFAYTLADCETQPSFLDTFLYLVSLWTRKDTALTEYVLNWLAHMIQKPTENPGVMLILTGQKGCGKDTLCNFLSTWVVGEKLSKSYGSTELFFDHYDSKQNKIFVRLQEANRATCLKYQDLLKSFITSETLNVNEKHKASFLTPNYCRFIFTTNKGNPVAFTEQERRFLILPCSTERTNDSAFWIPLYNTFFCQEAGKVVGEYLQSRDITGFNPRVYPVSDYQEAVIDTELSSEDKFIASWDGVKVKSTELFTKYKDWCIENSCPSIQFATSFGKALNKYLRDNTIQRKEEKTGVYYWKD